MEQQDLLVDLTNVVSVATRNTYGHTSISLVYADGNEEEVIRARFGDEVLLRPLLRQVEVRGLPITVGWVQ